MRFVKVEAPHNLTLKDLDLGECFRTDDSYRVYRCVFLDHRMMVAVSDGKRVVEDLEDARITVLDASTPVWRVDIEVRVPTAPDEPL